MLTRKLVSIIGAVALAAAGLVGLAGPAQADTTWNITIDCTTESVVLPGGPGDYYNITLTGDCYGGPTWDSWFWNAAYDDSDVGAQMGFLGVPSNQADFAEWYDCDYYCDGMTDWYLYFGGDVTLEGVQLLATNQVGQSLRSGIVGEIWAEAADHYVLLYWQGASAGPTEYWQQAYGRASAEATCDEGWSASWQQWPHDGAGGWVCVRDVVKYGS
jgi:hypothetical protein